MVRSLSLTARRRRGGPAVLPAGVFPAVLGAFWPAAVVAVCLALAAQPALAQDVEDQLQRLQRELSDLQRQVYGGAAPPAAAGGAAPTATAHMQIQLNDLERQLTNLTGPIAALVFPLHTATTPPHRRGAAVALSSPPPKPRRPPP